MGATAKRATFSLPTAIHRALKRNAIESERSMSELVSEAVQLSLTGDGEDVAAFDERAGERTVTIENVVKKLRRRAQL